MSEQEIGGLVGGMATTMLIVNLAIAIFFIIVQWKIFVKMGEPGWVALIPIYNMWKMFEHVWQGKGYMCLLTFIPFIGFIFPLIATFKLYQGFGKGTAFAVIGLFFAPICMAICAFDSSEFTDQ